MKAGAIDTKLGRRAFSFFVYSLSLINLSGAWWPREYPRIGLNRWLELDEEEHNGVGNWRADFENMTKGFLSITDQGQIYIVSSQITGIAFDCNATYPVKWVTHRQDESEYYSFYTRVRYIRSNPDVFNPRSNVFTAQLDLYGEQSAISGNYSCISTQYPDAVVKSIYVYWQGTNPSTLIFAGKSTEVQSSDGRYMFLPCKTSQPDTVVNLYREVNSEWVPVKSPFIKFNPKFGFRINLNQYNGAYGRFKCAVSDDEEESFVMNVKKGLRDDLKFNNTMTGNATIYFNRTTQEIICCSNSSKPPKLHTLFCVENFSCDIRRFQLHSIVNNGKRSRNQSCTSERIYNKDSGLLRCMGDGIDIVREFYTDLPTLRNNRTANLYFNWNDIQKENMVKISTTTRGPIYDTQNVTVSCDTAFNYFADGMQWAIRWKNNSLRFFPPPSSKGIVGSTDFYQSGLASFQSIRLQMSINMSEILCYAPIWNETDWVNKTFSLNVHETKRPVFEHPEPEVMQWVLNSTDHILECRVKGAPAPTIRWKKNNKTILPESNLAFKRHNGTASLTVHRVSHDVQGEYRCLATNFGGTSEKLFMVFVEEPSSSLGAVGLTVLIIMIAALVGGMGFLIWKMQLQKKVIDHLAGIVFRDVNSSQSNGISNAHNVGVAEAGSTSGNSAQNPFPSSIS